MNDTPKAVLLLATALFISCKSTQKSTHIQAGTWSAQPVTADGINSDWPAPYPYYDEKAKIGYAVANDRDNLYITMQTGDRQTIMKIMRNGLMVCIDTSGQKQMHTAITYPMPNTGSMQLQHEENNTTTPLQRPAQAAMQHKMLENARDMMLTGFNNCNGGFLVEQHNGCGIMVRMGFDEYNTLVWEAVVPWRSFYKNQLSAADAGKPISICFAVTGMKQPQGNGQQGMHNGGGMTGSGMGGGGMGGGGGMHGGMRGGMNGGTMDGDREHLFTSTKTWYHTGIAYKAG